MQALRVQGAWEASGKGHRGVATAAWYNRAHMKKGFYTIMAAQFFSSLADNALLISAIALLIEMTAPEWMKPMLKLFFTVSYVVLAPFVGAFADAMPKGRVMFVTNAIKVVGCVLMFAAVHPLLAYALVGLGAAAYSPAKYGILTELLPPERLVAANGWIEGTTVGSIILGTVLGGLLISPSVSTWILSLGIPGVHSAATGAIVVIGLVYLLAALINLRIPDTGARYPAQAIHPILLIRAFWECNLTLWRDKLGQISLAVTTLFWGAGAVLQFIVLEWAKHQLGLPLNRAAILQGVVAVGIALGAVLAARFITLRRSPRVIPLGIAMGLLVPLMTMVSTLELSYPLLVLVGGMAGYFVVPMNALLQHRGHVLMSAGHSIAVQNFNENLNVLVMLGVYAALLRFESHINTIIILFGLFVAVTMMLVRRRYRHNARHHDLGALILDHRAHGH